MKFKLLILLFFSALCYNQTISAQNISEHFGGIKTSYQFFTDTTDLEVKTQFIIRNAGYTYEIGSEYTHSYGAGFESLQLEFSTQIELAVFQRSKIRHPFYEVVFYDSDWKILTTMELHPGRFSIIRNPNQIGLPIFYSIDLFKIPISLFDTTSKINIMEIRPSR